jgi:hypothetical protein
MHLKSVVLICERERSCRQGGQARKGCNTMVQSLIIFSRELVPVMDPNGSTNEINCSHWFLQSEEGGCSGIGFCKKNKENSVSQGDSDCQEQYRGESDHQYADSHTGTFLAHMFSIQSPFFFFSSHF